MSRQSYKTSQWKSLRQRVLADTNQCQRCGRSSSTGAVLQIHHKFYCRSKKPWEYQLDELELLCKHCHAVEHGKIMPLYGWELTDECDSGGLNSECEFCGTPIRHIFTIEHAVWGAIEVGTHCCDVLTDTSVASTKRSEFSKRAKRLQSFMISKKWTETPDLSTITKRGIEMVVKKYAPGNFKISASLRGQAAQRGATHFNTLESAKEHLFDILDDGSLEKYLKRQMTSK